LKKRALNLIISLSIAISTILAVVPGNFSIANAATVNQAKIISVEIPADIDAYATKVFPNQIHSAMQAAKEYGLPDSNSTHYTLGTAFNVYKLSDESIDNTNIYYFTVLFDGKIVASLAVSKSQNGGISSTFSKGFAKTLETTVENNSNKQFRMVDIDGDIQAVSNTDTFLVFKDVQKETVPEVKPETIKKINKLAQVNTDAKKYKESISTVKAKVTNSKSIDTAMVSSLSSVYYATYLPVPVIYQNGKNWCWACTIASIVNYKKGMSLQGSNVVSYIYGGALPDVGGTTSQELSAFYHWGLYPTHYTSSQSFTATQAMLDSGNPLYTSWYNSSTGYWHAMTLRGYETYRDGSKNYLIIDPNYGYETVTAQDVSTSVYYTLGGRNYYWQECIKGF